MQRSQVAATTPSAAGALCGSRLALSQVQAGRQHQGAAQVTVEAGDLFQRGAGLVELVRRELPLGVNQQGAGGAVDVSRDGLAAQAQPC